MLTFRERLRLVLGLQAGCVYAVAWGGVVESLTWATSGRLLAGEAGLLMASVPLGFRPG